jgi:hypothetical protein
MLLKACGRLHCKENGYVMEEGAEGEAEGYIKPLKINYFVLFFPTVFFFC